MTIIRTIVGGPDQWDIMLSLFENKVVTITFEQGDSVSLILEALYDHRHGDPIVEAADYVGYPTGDGWLFSGYVVRTRDGKIVTYAGEKVWGEYALLSGTGSAIVMSDKEFNEQSETSYLPNVWSTLMGISIP